LQKALQKDFDTYVLSIFQAAEKMIKI